MNIFSDEYFMNFAIKEAKESLLKNEVPVGTVIVLNDEIIAKGHNLVESLKDVTAHAEIQAITSASNFLNSKYLNGCTLYTTLEPCIMCCGAIQLSQIGKIVFSATDQNKGAIYSGIKFSPKIKIIGGVLEEKTSELLKDFFKNKRK